MDDAVEDGEHLLEVARGEDGVEGLALPAVALADGAHQTGAQEEPVCPT